MKEYQDGVDAIANKVLGASTNSKKMAEFVLNEGARVRTFEVALVAGKDEVQLWNDLMIYDEVRNTANAIIAACNAYISG